MKRFYTKAHFECKNNVYYFYLDNKPIKTPMGQLLSTGSLGKANVIIAEWHAQTDDIMPNTMPVTKYINSVHDKIIPNHAYIINQLLHYADNDCLFYFTDQKETDLYHQQTEYWLPIIHYFEKHYGVTLNYGTDLLLDNQSDDFKKHLHDFFVSLSYETLAGLYTIITVLGSVLLGIYAYKKHIHYNTAFEYAHLEEAYNLKHSGTDSEAQSKMEIINQDFQHAIMFLDFDC